MKNFCDEYLSTNKEYKKENGNLMKVSSNAERSKWEAPSAQGLYDPQNEHEACGVGFIVSIDGTQSHKVTHDI